MEIDHDGKLRIMRARYPRILDTRLEDPNLRVHSVPPNFQVRGKPREVFLSLKECYNAYRRLRYKQLLEDAEVYFIGRRILGWLMDRDSGPTMPHPMGRIDSGKWLWLSNAYILRPWRMEPTTKT